jgi:serine/threonine protein kinase
MSDRSSLTLRRFFGPYQCLAKLGSGGMSSVYKARHRHTEAIVALKIASRRVINEPVLAIRFQNEYETAQQLRHPRLVAVLEYGNEEGTPYLVLEYVTGQSLDQRLLAKGQIPQDEVLWLAQQIGEVIQFIHDHNFVHRDIKPGNILLAETREAKLTDLGLVKDLETQGALTGSSTGLGTMDYAAPEQFDNAKHVDCRADVYSLAATLYKALTGQYPFGKGGLTTILNRKLNNQFTPLTDVLPEVSPAVDRAIARALQGNRDRRPATVAGFLDALMEGANATC